jgi:hypothetical protein
MNNTSPASVNSSSPEFVSFLQGAQKLLDTHLAEMCPNLVTLQADVLVVEEGPRYLRIVRETRVKSSGEVVSRSAHAFLDRASGDVLKAAGWKAPAKGARGNIFDAANGLARMSAYGPAYNR